MNKYLIPFINILLLQMTLSMAGNVTVTMYDESQYASGYTIFGTLEGKYSAIFDKNGGEIWNSENQEIVYYNFSSEGNFFGCQYLDNNIYENYLNSIEFSLTEGIVWQEPSEEFAHHEILKLPWGNYLGIVSHDTLAPIPEGNWGALPFFHLLGDEFPWRYDKLVEWDKDTKEVVWSWSAIAHYSMEDYDSTLWNLTTLNAGIIEWTHINSLIFDAQDSSIYISSRHLSRITKIDYPSGEIIWNMGHEMPSGDVSFGHDLGFSWQHSLDFHNGNIVFLDNGNKSMEYRNTDYRTTRAIEISVDESFPLPVAEIVWEYELPENLFGMASGNVQKLHNGNYLITTMGNSGTSLEVTPDHQIVWEANYGTPLVYRASRLPASLVCSQIDCPDLNTSNNLIIDKFTIHQIFPNPFNPIINIEYEISRYGFISANMLNLRGQHIDELYSGYKKPGNYSITWDGSLQPSGMYLVVLENQTSKLTQKIMLVK